MMIYPINFVFKEVWADFPYSVYPMVARHYKVSNSGFVYNLATGNIIPLNKSYNKDHYITIRLSTIDGGGFSISLYRVILNAFCPIPYENLYDVNHKDGIKYHNWLWNLEWCTKNENMQHAVNNNLITLGEDRSNSVVTNEQVEYICYLISEGYSTKQICSIFPIENCDMRRLVQNIKNGHCWKHISSKYNFDNMDKVYRILSYDQINIICKYLESNPKISTKEVLNYIGLDYGNMDKKNKARYATLISCIRNKKTFINICDKYDY